MPALRTRNLFISHSWGYGDQYSNLVRLLDGAPNFSYRNYSVPKDDPVHNAPSQAALRAAIKQQMVFCSVILVVAGKYATFSSWIKNELEIAAVDYDKAILGIRPFGSTQVSSVVQEVAHKIVNWSTSSIVSAIRELDP
jgi:hypothetical protein